MARRILLRHIIYIANYQNFDCILSVKNAVDFLKKYLIKQKLTKTRKQQHENTEASEQYNRRVIWTQERRQNLGLIGKIFNAIDNTGAENLAVTTNARHNSVDYEISVSVTEVEDSKTYEPFDECTSEAVETVEKHCRQYDDCEGCPYDGQLGCELVSMVEQKEMCVFGEACWEGGKNK